MFFFQAEDGIRYLVRSRGLGDVYKRQQRGFVSGAAHRVAGRAVGRAVARVPGDRAMGADAVSYTHLTLPTSDLV